MNGPAKIKVVLPLIMVLFGSCQDDINIDTSDPDTNDGGSVFTAKAKRSSMFDGSYDDILDSSPCTAVQFPVEILLNNNPITLNNMAELAIIGENDVIKFSFPITITNFDHEISTVGDALEWAKIMEGCNTMIDNGEGPITCTDIEYPITVFTATKGNVQNDFSLANDKEFYIFLDKLGPTDRYNIKYPLDTRVDQSSVITVNNDLELENLMDSCTR